MGRGSEQREPYTTTPLSTHDDEIVLLGGGGLQDLAIGPGRSRPLTPPSFAQPCVRGRRPHVAHDALGAARPLLRRAVASDEWITGRLASSATCAQSAFSTPIVSSYETGDPPPRPFCA